MGDQDSGFALNFPKKAVFRPQKDENLPTIGFSVNFSTAQNLEGLFSPVPLSATKPMATDRGS